MEQLDCFKSFILVAVVLVEILLPLFRLCFVLAENQQQCMPSSGSVHAGWLVTFHVDRSAAPMQFISIADGQKTNLMIAYGSKGIVDIDDDTDNKQPQFIGGVARNSPFTFISIILIKLR